MRTIPDRKLTNNFSLYEFIEAKHNRQAVAMNWNNIHEMNIALFEKVVAPFFQTLRHRINQNFKSDTGADQIGITITSGWRCVEWEVFKKRSGKGQHPIGAGDGQPSNCSPEMAVEIIAWVKAEYWPNKTGHNGGFAIKEPTYDPKSGELIKAGFFHFDFRNGSVRWLY